MPKTFTVALESGAAVGGLIYTAGRDASHDTSLILAHGAGAPQTHPFMTAFARGLARRGLDVVTFNFLYMERARRVPDPKARLESCYRAVIETTRERVKSAARRLIVGGKSMGGRIASQVVAGDAASGDPGVDGLVFLGYPLHPPGRNEKLRAAHLASIPVPMLFVQGSRDTFGTPGELEPVLAGCVAATLRVVEGGDHSFKVRGKDARSAEEIYTMVQDCIIDWIKRSG